MVSNEIVRELFNLKFENKIDILLSEIEKYLEIDSNDPIINLIKGQIYLERNDFNTSKFCLLKAINTFHNLTWVHSWGHIYLAKIELIERNERSAIEHIRISIKQNATPYSTRTAQNLAIKEGYCNLISDWKIFETKHLIICFPSHTIVRNLVEYTDSREKAFIKINKLFNAKITRKIKMVIWNNATDAKDAGLFKLGFANVDKCLIHAKYDQTIGHEITHIIIQFLSENIIRTRFINEGIAVAFDLSSYNKLKEAISFKRMSDYKSTIYIKEAWNNPRKYPEWVYYSLAGEFIKRIFNRFGKDKFLQLVINQTYQNAINLYGAELQNIIIELEQQINDN